MKSTPYLPGWPRALRREWAAAYVGLGTSTFDQGVEDGDLPKPIPTIGTVKAWLLDDLDAWLDRKRAEREAAARGDDANPWDDE
jgi:predicted DNA-binding transcriptional regulator AlpA